MTLANPNPSTSVLGRRAHEVYEALLRDIRRDVYPAGTRLPTEQLLTARFGVGRNTIRSALARLAAEEWIVTVRGSGSTVLPPVMAERTRTIAVMYVGSMDTLSEQHRAIIDSGHIMSYFSQLPTRWSPLVEQQFLEQVRAQHHRGLVAYCTPVQPRNDELLAELGQSGVKVVHIEHYRPTMPAESYVLPDYWRAGYAAAVKLMLAGYERFCYVSMPGADGPHTVYLRDGFRAALCDEYATQVDDGAMLRDFSMPRHEERDREAKFDQLAQERSVGILVNTFDRAHIIETALRKRGMRIPEDAGVIGVQTAEAIRESSHDAIVFDRDYIFKRALEVICEDSPRVQELVPHRYIPGNTVRVR